MSTAKPRTRATPKVVSRIPRNGGTADKENKNTKTLGPANAGKMDEELEKKFNIEGLNTIDIVYARQENDVARARLTEQDSKIAAQELLNVQLMQELAALRSRLEPSDVEMDEDHSNAGENQSNTSAEDVDKHIAAALEKERAKNAELQRRLDQLSNTHSDQQEASVPRPAGSSGNNYNIQNEMHLGGSRANREIYKGLVRHIHDLTLQAGINWELSWSEVPAGDKAKLFDVARGRHPILAKYANDWATEEIVKQFVKNKRRYAYRNGWLDVPEKYKYLKTNSAKRDPSASRKRRTVATGSTGAAKVSVAIKKAAKAKNSKKIKSKSSGSKSGSRGKGKQVVVSDEEDDDEEMYASEKDEE